MLYHMVFLFFCLRLVKSPKGQALYGRPNKQALERSEMKPVTITRDHRPEK